MPLPALYGLTVTLHLASGAMAVHRRDLRAGGLDFVLWLRGVRIPGLASSVVATVVDRDASPPLRDVELPVAVLDELATLLADAGGPARAPRVNGRVDTSDGWCELRLALTVNDQPTVHVAIDAMSSGYEGPDAAALRALCARLVALVGSARRLP